jgi:predicted 3-demethylubiquinone-9 3-methyltransferase (glyoxalase superfamily)
MITPFLWFDGEAEEAVKFYTSLFDNSDIGAIVRYGKEGYEVHGQPEGKVLTVEFELSGFRIVALNGGPHFKFTPATSFFVVCETEHETDRLWEKLANGGSMLFPLDKYDWSEKYGWIKDRYGLSWQISLGRIEDVGQKITPAFLFVNEQMGRAEEAIRLYTSVFKPSSIDGILKYGPGEEGPEGTIKHAQFNLSGGKFMVMDGPGKHDFSFNESISFEISCEDQEEIDYYWEKLTADGGEESMCGWLKDTFGVSWQVVPSVLSKMLKDPDAEKSARVTKAFLQMKKFNIEQLKHAYEGTQKELYR